jgi:hypothetical protein
VGVDLRVLQPVDLDADELGVDQLGQIGVVEEGVGGAALVRGCVPDRHQQRPVLIGGPAESLFAPGEPMDGLAGLASQVGGGFFGKLIGAGSCVVHLKFHSKVLSVRELRTYHGRRISPAPGMKLVS